MQFSDTKLHRFYSPFVFYKPQGPKWGNQSRTWNIYGDDYEVLLNFFSNRDIYYDVMHKTNWYDHENGRNPYCNLADWLILGIENHGRRS